MTLKSVVLPAPFGPMMPRISPGEARSETLPTAVSPPKRFVTASSSSMKAHGAKALAEPADQAPRDEAHDQDQQAAIDDQVDADEAAPDIAEGREEEGFERGDEDGSHERAHGRADAADDRVELETDREVHREDVEGIDEAHVLRPERSAARGERGACRHRHDLEPAAWDAKRLRGVLVLAHAGQLVADARALEVDLHGIDRESQAEYQVDPRDLAREAERPEAWPERDGHALRA